MKIIVNRRSRREETLAFGKGELETRYLVSYKQGFTMIEIAFSLAIVAFALVAIMGVLPLGMTVQKDNREDTIINQDGMFWLESMRSGSRGIDDLTNYVEAITISNRLGVGLWVPPTDNTPGAQKINSGEQIVGLLSTPKYLTNGAPAEWVTNVVTARVRAITGPAAEKGNPTNEFSFRYELRSEVTASLPTPPGMVNIAADDINGRHITDSILLTKYGTNLDQNVEANLNNLRLTLRWPLFQQGTNWGVGGNRRNLRGLVSGRLQPTIVTNVTATNYFVQPNTYEYVP